jgi:hypothetical protein
MWKSFIDSVLRFEGLRIGVWLLLSVLFGLFQYFHILPEAFFTSSTYGFIQFFLYIALSFFVIYAIYKNQHKKNLERLKKDMEELTQSVQKSAVTTNDTTH